MSKHFAGLWPKSFAGVAMRCLIGLLTITLATLGLATAAHAALSASCNQINLDFSPPRHLTGTDNYSPDYQALQAGEYISWTFSTTGTAARNTSSAIVIYIDNYNSLIVNESNIGGNINKSGGFTASSSVDNIQFILDVTQDSSADPSDYNALTFSAACYASAPTVPGAPSIGAATAGDAQASVTFSAPASNGGAAITGYTVTASPGGATGTGSSSPITVLGLTNGAAYTFSVVAINSVGPGSASTASNSVTPTAALLAPVANAVSASVAANSSNNPITLNLSGGAASGVAIGTAASHGTATASGTAIAYTPTAGYAGSDSFTYTATNTSGTSTPATVSITVTAPTFGFSPAGGALGGGTVGTAYSQTITASGGSGSYTYMVVSGTLPAGLSLNTTTGAITGTPTTAGNAAFRIAATDANSATGSVNYTLAVAATTPGAPSIGTATAGDAGASVTFSAPASNGGAAITTYTVTASPGGATGTGSASPITVMGLTNGTAYTFTVVATNSVGPGSASVASNSVTPVAALLAPVANAVSATVAANSSNNAITLNLSGGAASGVAIGTAASHGTATAAGTAITYTPTAGYSGTDSFTYTATNTSGTSTPATVSITVSASTLALSPAAGALPDGMKDEGYSTATSVTGATGVVTFAVTGGALPAGLILNQSTGALTGTITAPVGSYSFTLTATDTVGSASANYTLAVRARELAATNKQVVIRPGATPLPVDLTAGATGGPFTNAIIGTVTPPNAGTATITMGDVAAVGTVYPTTFYLKFTPNPQYSGVAVVGYRLVSALGTSNDASVTYQSSINPAAVGDTFDSLAKDFVATRQSLLVGSVHAPGLRERRAMAAGARAGTVEINPRGNSINMRLASSLVELQAWQAGGDAAGALAGVGDAEPVPFNIWIDANATLHLHTDGNDNRSGKFALVSVGADYLVTDRLLLGLAFHADVMDDFGSVTQASGKGFLVGPNLSTELVDGVFLDGELLYGQSWNSMTIGRFSGNFETERLMANLKLEGEWAINDALTFLPNVTAFYLWESAGRYTVSSASGDEVDVAGFVSSQIRLSVGGTLEYVMPLGEELTLMPRLGASIGTTASGDKGLLDNPFGTISGGLDLAGHGNWRLGGSVQAGIEASSLRSISGNLNFRVGF